MMGFSEFASKRCRSGRARGERFGKVDGLADLATDCWQARWNLVSGF